MSATNRIKASEALGLGLLLQFLALERGFVAPESDAWLGYKYRRFDQLFPPNLIHRSVPDWFLTIPEGTERVNWNIRSGHPVNNVDS